MTTTHITTDGDTHDPAVSRDIRCELCFPPKLVGEHHELRIFFQPGAHGQDYNLGYCVAGDWHVERMSGDSISHITSAYREHLT